MLNPTTLPSMLDAADVIKNKSKQSNTKESSLRVIIRIRPPISSEVQSELAVSTDNSTGVYVRSEKHDTTCQYDKVFGETSTQVDIFQEITPLLYDVLKGYNACIFAYGQTSAGKTHTMLGPDGGAVDLISNKKKWGVLPRSAELLFNELEKRSNEGIVTYKVTASFLQIYNENLYDLLRKSNIYHDDYDEASAENGILKIREITKPKGSAASEAHEVYVSGLSEFRVQTAEDVLKIIAIGSANRATRSTDYNATSSRSHAILQLNFELNSTDPITERQVISKSKLSLVDLAGSEKMQTSTEPSEKHLKELTSINKSLSSLGNVISALSSSSRSHIPYRDSKLTRLLQDSLGGNTRTAVIACVAPTVLHVSESLSTLQFADRARSVMSKVKANTMVDDQALLSTANQEISRLKQLLHHTLLRQEMGQPLTGDYGEGGDNIILEENMKLREENKRLKEEILAYESIFNADSNVIERDRRGRVKPPRPKKSIKQLLKPLAKINSSKVEGNSHMQRLNANTEDMNEDMIYSDDEPEDRQLSFGPGRVRPRYISGSEIGGKQIDRLKKSNSAMASLSSHPLRHSGLYGDGIMAPVLQQHTKKSVNQSTDEILGLFNPRTFYTNDNTNNLLSSESKNDITKLKEEINRPKSKAELRQLKKTIDAVDIRTKQQLQEESSSLQSIQAMKRSLERQLAKLQHENVEVVNPSPSKLRQQQTSKSPHMEASSSPSKMSPLKLIHQALLESETAGYGRLSVEALEQNEGYDDDFEIIESPIKSNNSAHLSLLSPSRRYISSPNNKSLSLDHTVASGDQVIALSPPKAGQKQLFDEVPSGIVSSSGNEKRIGTATGHKAGLLYSHEDIGKKFEMFAFRYSSWEVVEVLDFEEGKLLHRCKLADGSMQWMDLKKKPIRKAESSAGM